MKIVYIAHPIGSDIEKNLVDLRRIIHDINLGMPNILPFCPYYADVVSLNDNNPSHRERGLINNLEIIKSGIVQEMWLTGTMISNGMRMEIEAAEAMSIPVIDFTNCI